MSDISEMTERLIYTASMLKRYPKQDAPAWQRRLVLILWSLFAATLLLFAAWAVVLFIDWARVDACLDQGGSYDYQNRECDFESNHASP